MESNYFPYDNIKQDIITKYKPSNHNIASLKYQWIGFNVTTSYSKIHINPIEKINTIKTRIDIPLIDATIV